jgi:hypothetical protein
MMFVPRARHENQDDENNKALLGRRENEDRE